MVSLLEQHMCMDTDIHRGAMKLPSCEEEKGSCPCSSSLVTTYNTHEQGRLPIFLMFCFVQGLLL